MSRHKHHEAVQAFAHLFPPNPRKYGQLRGIDPVTDQKQVVTHSQGVTLSLIAAHLGVGQRTPQPLGYLPGSEQGTTVGMIDLDEKDYPRPGSLEDAKQALIDVARGLNLHVYVARSTRGYGYHLYFWVTTTIPYAVMRDALRFVVVRASLKPTTEVFPKGDNVSSNWYFLPYHGALQDPERLGRRHLEAEDGQGIPVDELDEWIQANGPDVIEDLARMQQEHQATRALTATVGSAAGETTQAVLLRLPLQRAPTNRHDTLPAFLNVAQHRGVLREMQHVLTSRDVHALWIPDNSRTFDQWGQEVDRWVKIVQAGQAERTRGIPHLEREGYEVSALREPGAQEDDPDAFPEVSPLPVLNDRALHGLAGDIIRAIAPHTEAHPAGMLVTLLAVIGVMLGPALLMRAGGAPHPLRIWPLLVGNTANGRKGTSWHAVRVVLQAAFDNFAQFVTTGLSTGEGLIHAVRDPVVQQKPVKGQPGAFEEEVLDAGVLDKRLVDREDEFGRMLKVMTRESNTLSAVLRQTWDVGPDEALSNLAKSGARATGAHISIIGNITQGELQRYLKEVDAINGFANRFLWVMVSRVRELPFGGAPGEDVVQELAQRVRVVADWANQQHTELTWAPCGAELWVRAYSELSAPKVGLVGSVLGRAEAYVTRLTALYAVLDRSVQLRREHLEAALALWAYCEASTQYIFAGGTETGDKTADRILLALRQQKQLTRTEIRDLFNKHATKDELDKAVALLVQGGVARVSTGEKKNGGRAAKLLILVERAA